MNRLNSTIKNKKKKCKGTGRAVTFGCGESFVPFKFGLCRQCYIDWLLKSPSGKDTLEKLTIKGKKKVNTEKKKKLMADKKAIKTPSELKKDLQKEVNTIVRLIDHDKGCISCEHGWGKPWTRVKNAGHRLSVGGHASTRFHMFNIYLQCSICNTWKSSNALEYDKGLVIHYSQEELDRCNSLEAKYPLIKLTKTELHEKIIIAKRIVKLIKSGVVYTRDMVNKELGIYK